MLTVGELRAFMQNKPDDMPVMLLVGDYSCMSNLERPETDCFEESGSPLVLLLAGEPDKDENGKLL